MAAKNDITGDSIKSKTGNSDAYAKGWDRIFGGKSKRSNTEVVLIAAGKGVGKSTFNETKDRTPSGELAEPVRRRAANKVRAKNN